jgi:transposase InsO family protein
MFGARRIQRRVYSVPGPNSLYHHDGQHGPYIYVHVKLQYFLKHHVALIQYRLVIHTFVDGFSRFVTGICVSDNNRADTVLDLFLDIIDEHGVPSGVRGDHGTENLRVAEWMENLGVLNEVHIYGGGKCAFKIHINILHLYSNHSSVHNIRIECLWHDVTQGFGRKWKQFFQLLELHHDLKPNLDAHVWLLHHVFLDAVNDDAFQWVEAWNHH